MTFIAGPRLPGMIALDARRADGWRRISPAAFSEEMALSLPALSRMRLDREEALGSLHIGK